MAAKGKKSASKRLPSRFKLTPGLLHESLLTWEFFGGSEERVEVLSSVRSAFGAATSMFN